MSICSLSKFFKKNQSMEDISHLKWRTWRSKCISKWAYNGSLNFIWFLWRILFISSSTLLFESSNCPLWNLQQIMSTDFFYTHLFESLFIHFIRQVFWSSSTLINIKVPVITSCRSLYPEARYYIHCIDRTWLFQ